MNLKSSDWCQYFPICWLSSTARSISSSTSRKIRSKASNWTWTYMSQFARRWWEITVRLFEFNHAGFTASLYSLWPAGSGGRGESQARPQWRPRWSTRRTNSRVQVLVKILMVVSYQTKTYRESFDYQNPRQHNILNNVQQLVGSTCMYFW